MLTQAVNKVWKNCWGVKTVSGPKKTQTVEGVALISTKAFFFANKAPGVNMIQKRQTVLVPRLRSFQLVNLCSILQCRWAWIEAVTRIWIWKLGGSFQSWKSWCPWWYVSELRAPRVCQGLCSSKYRLRTLIWGTVTRVCALIASMTRGLHFSGWLGGGAKLTWLTSALTGFNQHQREIRATARVIHFNFYSPLTPFHVLERSIQYGPVSSSSSSLFLPSYLISPSPQEAICSKRCLLKGYDGSVCFDMLLCLMSCQDVRTAMGWDGIGWEEWGRGGGRGKELSRDLG